MIKSLLLSLSLLMFAPLAAMAEDAEKSYVEGTDYDLITPAVRTANPDKIEVAEFFWYGCGHCYTFEPVLGQWKKTLADDVDFQGSPAMWNKPMELHAQAYYTAQVLGVLDKLNEPLFAALNTPPSPKLDTEDELATFFAGYGVADADFRKAFNSFGVSSLVRQADARARSTQIEGTQIGRAHV